MNLMQEYRQAIKELGQANNYFHNVIEDEEILMAIVNVNVKEYKVKLIRELLGEKV